MRSQYFLMFGGLIVLGAVTTGYAQSPLPGAIQPGTVQARLNPIASGLVSPVGLLSAPGDPSDLYVVDQTGKVNVIHNGVLQSTPLINLSSTDIPLSANYDERGLLGLAFSPGFSNSASPGFHTLYTYQSEPAGTAASNFAPASGTVTSGIDHQNVLTEWKVSAANPNVVDTTTRRDLLREDHPALNHNGGTIAFGTDGLLYLGIGDGGTANDTGNGHLPNGNAPDNSVIMGKIIRIDPNARTGNRAYGIPSDNPFVNTQGALPEIYANGFRNPYKFSFDQGTNRLIVGDVGQNNIEEVDIVTSGGNYGWSVKEGTFLFNRTGANAGSIGANSPGSPGGLIDPVLEYDHTAGIATVGGFVYHGSLFPQLVGKYIFGDLGNGNANGRLFYADLSTGQINEFALNAPLGIWLKGLGEDSNGEIYALGSKNLGPSGTSGVVMELVPEPAVGTLLSLCALAVFPRRRTQL